MSSSLFSGLTAAPADPILGVAEKFRADPRAEKVNLGVGAYLTEEGVTPILEVVQEAEETLTAARIPHTYIPISGLAGYGALVQKMVFGAESEVVLSGRAATVQTLGPQSRHGLYAPHLRCHGGCNEQAHLGQP